MQLGFAGTPEFAVATLEALVDSDHELVGAITNPDRARGRGSEPTPPPVKRAARDADVPVYQPEDVDVSETRERLEAWQPEALVVAAYGQILPEWLLDWPEHGCLNVHASLLPDYRGAAPINWAIVRGEERTGVTIMRMVPELDAGPVYARRVTEIGELETAGDLHDRLAPMGGELAVEVLDDLERGRAEAEPQDHEAATYAPKLSKSDGAIDWEAPGERVADHIRGMNPWPGAHADLEDGDRIKFHLAAPEAGEGKPGRVLEADPSDDRLVVACGDGAIRVLELQAPGGRKLEAGPFLNGHPLDVGDRFV